MSEENFYSRQTTLKEIGLKGQKKLKLQKVLIVGAGGLGHPVATYLAAAGIGEICIIDFDRIEESNLNRQVCFTINNLGKEKATTLAGKIQLQNPYIKVEGLVEKLAPHNAKEIIDPFDMILDCSDNLATKFLLHDFAWSLKKDLIQASIYQYEGQIQSFNFSKNNNRGCLRCLWPKIPTNNCVQNCQEAGVIGAVAGALGNIQALEAVKLLLGLGKNFNDTTITVDLLTLEIQKIKWTKNNSCPLCSLNKSIDEIRKDHNIKCNSFELTTLDQRDFVLVDIREEDEIRQKEFHQSYSFINLPFSKAECWFDQIDTNKKYLFICERGLRSAFLVKKMRTKNMLNCFSLSQGLASVRS